MREFIEIREKGLRTIEQFPLEDLVHVYTDGSSDKTITNGKSGVFLTTLSNTSHQGKFGAGTIAPNFTSELWAIVQALYM